MKKVLASLCALVGVCLLVSSCGERIVSDETDAQQLVRELSEFNSSWLNDNEGDLSVLPTKGWLGVAGADVGGAWRGFKWGSRAGALAGPHSAGVLGVLGGVLVGTVSSLAEYHTSAQFDSDLPSPVDMLKTRNAYKSGLIRLKNLKLTVSDVERNFKIPSKYSSLLSIGEMHNAILEILMNSSIEVPDGEIDPFEQNVISSDDFLSLYYLGSGDESNSGSVGTDVLDQIEDLFMQVFSRAQTDIPSVDHIHYVKTIEGYNNVLSEEDKQTLYAGLSVAVFSARYWSNRY